MVSMMISQEKRYAKSNICQELDINKQMREMSGEQKGKTFFI